MTRTLGMAALVALGFGTGCLPTLDECTEADRLAYENGDNLVFENAIPMFDGQQLILSSCGNGSFCHASRAEGVDRVGAPAGLDFDVFPACSNESTCAEVEFERMDRASRIIFRHRRRIMDEVRSGRMPPGGAAHVQVFGVDAMGEPNPAPIDAEGAKDRLEKWLSCGAPLVETTAEPGDGVAPFPGDSCAVEPGRTGFCFVRQPIPVPDPTWESIYAEVIEPVCVSCHRPASPNFVAIEPGTGEHNLDFSSCGTAYQALLGGPTGGGFAAGADCGSEVRQFVVAGDPSGSLLIHKLEGVDEGGQEVCGDPMPTPPLAPLHPDTIAPIREWITMNAPEPTSASCALPSP